MSEYLVVKREECDHVGGSQILVAGPPRWVDCDKCGGSGYKEIWFDLEKALKDIGVTEMFQSMERILTYLVNRRVD